MFFGHMNIKMALDFHNLFALEPWRSFHVLNALKSVKLMCLNVITAKTGFIEIVCQPRLSVYGLFVLKHSYVGNVVSMKIRMMLKPDLKGNLHFLVLLIFRLSAVRNIVHSVSRPLHCPFCKSVTSAPILFVRPSVCLYV